MKVGLLADIHANADALEAVLAAARQERVELLIIAGDFVGYYYEPDRCLDLLEPWPTVRVRGNHEDLLRLWCADATVHAQLRARYGSGLEEARRRLGGERLASLDALDVVHAVTVDGRTLQVGHGAPWSTDEYLYPDAPAEQYSRCAEAGYDYVVLGHTHYPMIRRVGETTVVNPGSVGQPRDRQPGAAWGLLDTRTMTYSQRREAYDSGNVIRRSRELDPHLPYLAEVLVRR